MKTVKPRILSRLLRKTLSDIYIFCQLVKTSPGVFSVIVDQPEVRNYDATLLDYDATV